MLHFKTWTTRFLRPCLEQNLTQTHYLKKEYIQIKCYFNSKIQFVSKKMLLQDKFREIWNTKYDQIH